MRRIWLSAVLLGVFPMSGKTQQQFQAHLRHRLVADDQVFLGAPLEDASAADVARFKPRLAAGSKVQTGTVELSSRVKILIALVTRVRESKCLYYNTTGVRTFGSRHRVCFCILAHSHSYADEAKIELPIHLGTYSSIPLIFRTSRPTDSSLPAKNPMLFYNSQVLVEGSASINGKAVPLAYRLNLSDGSVDVTGTTYMDEDGDGVLHPTRERKLGTETAPIFHIGDQFVSTKAIDVAAHRAVLISHPASDYHRDDYAKGATLPDFQFTTFDGDVRSLSSVKGRLVLIDFWASWCQPCIQDFPHLKAVYNEFHAKGFDIIGIDGDRKDPEKAAAAVAKFGIKWPQSRYNDNLIQERFQVLSWPTFILLDEKRRVVSSESSELFGEKLRHAVEAALTQEP